MWTKLVMIQATYIETTLLTFHKVDTSPEGRGDKVFICEHLTVIYICFIFFVADAWD